MSGGYGLLDWTLQMKYYCAKSYGRDSPASRDGPDRTGPGSLGVHTQFSGGYTSVRVGIFSSSESPSAVTPQTLLWPAPSTHLFLLLPIAILMAPRDSPLSLL